MPPPSDRMAFERRPLVRMLQTIDVCFARIYHQLAVTSPQRLPLHGPAILVCNHTSSLDPLLIQAACPRIITWMMAREYYEVRGLSWIFRQVGAIPVDRSGRDLSATRSAMRALAAGSILGVFPEGQIETTRELLPFHTGVALMALKTDVPVFPAYLDGTQRGLEIARAVIQSSRAKIAFGPVVPLERGSTTRQALEAATQKIANAVADLRDKQALADL